MRASIVGLLRSTASIPSGRHGFQGSLGWAHKPQPGVIAEAISRHAG